MGMQTLGLGSDSRLTMDTIDKLKAVDTTTTVKPIEKNLLKVQAKSEAISQVSTLLSGFKTVASDLSDDMLYLGRSAYVSGEGIIVDIDKGVQTQSISIEITQLAQEEVVQSDTFESRSSKVSSGDGTFEIEVDGKTHTFAVTSSTTLENLMQDINDDSSLNVKAKILNTGKDEYRLILTGSDTGVENKLKITESENLTTKLSAESNLVQEAKDSKFTYNGVDVSRSSNSVSDLIVGVKLDFTQITDKPIVIDIKEDVNSIATKLDTFVKSYNELTKTLDELTNFNEETKEAGVLQGDSDIRTIRREINKILLSMDSENRSITDIGMDLNKTGVLSLDLDVFTTKFEESSSNIQEFFQGTRTEVRGVSSHKDGLFYNLEQSLDNYVGSNSLLANLSTSFDSQETRLNKEKEKAVATLDSRYERMAAQFAQQDAIISQIEQQFKSIQMQIDMDNKN